MFYGNKRCYLRALTSEGAFKCKLCCLCAALHLLGEILFRVMEAPVPLASSHGPQCWNTLALFAKTQCYSIEKVPVLSSSSSLKCLAPFSIPH